MTQQKYLTTTYKALDPDKQNIFESRQNALFIQSQPVKATSTLDTKSLPFTDSKDILKNAAILDIETLGLKTESMHEVALFNLEQNELNIFIPEANLIRKLEETNANMVSSSKLNQVNVLKGMHPDLVKQMSFRDIAIVDYLMNKNSYNEILENIKNLKRNATYFNNLDTVLQNQIQSLERKLIKVKDFDNNSSAANEILKAETLLVENNALNPELENPRLLREVGLHAAFERDEPFLSKYILEGSESFNKFLTSNPAEAEYLKYMRTRNMQYDSNTFNALMQDYFSKFKYSSQRISGLAKDVKINVHTNVSMKQMQQQLAQLMKNKTLYVANIKFEAKKFGSQIASEAREEMILAEQVYRQENNIPDNVELSKRQIADLRSRAFIRNNPFMTIAGIPASASTGEPFYSTGIEYNAALTEARVHGDYSNVSDVFFQTTKPGSARDIQDVIRSQQSMLVKEGLLSNVSSPLGLSIEAQSRLYMFTNALSENAPEAELKEILSSFKETHTAGLDTLIHENIVLRESVVQAEALSRFSKMPEEEKIAYVKNLKRTDPLYRAAAYSKIFEEIVPKIQEINLQSRIVSDLGEIADTAQISASQLTETPLYREQQHIQSAEQILRNQGVPESSVQSLKDLYSDTIVTEKIKTPSYNRKIIASYTSFKKNLQNNDLYNYAGRNKEFEILEQELLDKRFIYHTGDTYEFDSDLLDSRKQSEAAIKKRAELKSFLQTRGNKVHDLIKGFESLSESLITDDFSNKVEKSLLSRTSRNIPRLNLEKFKKPYEIKTTEKIRDVIKKATEHKHTASLLQSRSKPIPVEAMINEIQHHAFNMPAGYQKTTSGYSEAEINLAKQKFLAGEPIYAEKNQKIFVAPPETNREEAFARAFFEIKHYESTGQVMDSKKYVASRKQNYGSLTKEVIKQAATRQIELGDTVYQFEKDLNEVPVYNQKTLGDYRSGFRNYIDYGEIKTSYGATYIDPSHDASVDLNEQAKKYADLNFRLEESFNMPKDEKGGTPIYNEKEIKNYIFDRKVPDNIKSKPVLFGSSELATAPTTFKALPPGLTVSELDNIANTIVEQNFDNGLNKVFSEFASSSAGLKFFGMYAAGAAALATLSLVQEPALSKASETSTLSPSYDRWFENQKKFFGSESNFKTAIKDKYFASNDGLAENGLASLMRKVNTDFGSPYQGPATSYSVFEDQELIRERQKYSSYMFNERHFTERGDIFNLLRSHIAYKPEMREIFREFASPNQGLTQEQLLSLKGNNLKRLVINKDDFHISVEDADTITLQRKGATNNPLSKFMGSGNYSFRLAGIDAPETSHDERAAQPHAEISKEMLKSLMQGKELSLVFDPTNITYGRQVATLFAGDRNLNLELLKRGAVAYLPYEGKGQEQMYNEKAFSAAQKYAVEQRRGMWSEPFFQVYNEMNKQTQQTVTFNTFANKTKSAENANLTNILGIMLSAQKQGKISDFHREEMDQTFNEIKNNTRQVSIEPSVLISEDLKKKYSQKKNVRPFDADFDQHRKMARHNEHMPSLQYDLKRLIETKGSKDVENKLKYSGQMLENNIELLETVQSTSNNSQVSKITNQTTNKAIRARRFNDMQIAQHKALIHLKQNHTRM
jgi:endonuclease YncB( thermonuclease family)